MAVIITAILSAKIKGIILSIFACKIIAVSWTIISSIDKIRNTIGFWHIPLGFFTTIDSGEYSGSLTLLKILFCE